MILHLRNNHIYLPMSNVIIHNDTTRVYIDVQDIDRKDYRFIVDINGEQSTFKESFVIDPAQFKHNFLNIKIKAININTGEEIVYEADSYPITKAVILGRPSNEWYPEVITNLVNRVEYLENMLAEHLNKITANSEDVNAIQTNIKLIELAIKEINETGEVV